MAEKSCRGGFLESLCQWVALQNQQCGRSSSARGWGWDSSAATALTECCTSRGLAMGIVGTLQPAWGSREDAGREASPRAGGTAGVWGQPRSRSVNPPTSTGDTANSCPWVTSPKAGAAPQLPCSPAVMFCSQLKVTNSSP